MAHITKIPTINVKNFAKLNFTWIFGGSNCIIFGWYLAYPYFPGVFPLAGEFVADTANVQWLLHSLRSISSELCNRRHQTLPMVWSAPWWLTGEWWLSLGICHCRFTYSWPHGSQLWKMAEAIMMLFVMPTCVGQTNLVGQYPPRKRSAFEADKASIFLHTLAPHSGCSCRNFLTDWLCGSNAAFCQTKLETWAVDWSAPLLNCTMACMTYQNTIESTALFLFMFRTSFR